MKLLFMAILGLLLAPQTAQAEIVTLVEKGTLEHPALIGFLLATQSQSNIEVFHAIAEEEKVAPVFFDSPGGALAIQLGNIIRERGLKTAAADNPQCASACALVWLSGKERFMGKNARIGFHSIRVSKRTSEVSYRGNAAVEGYLNYALGLTNPEVASYVTNAPPLSMTSLTMSDAKQLGLDVKPFSLSQDQRAWARTALARAKRKL
jgi:hypothetical protein